MVVTRAELMPFWKESSASSAALIFSKLPLQFPNLLIEGVIALFELRRGERALNADLQQAIFFCINSRQLRLYPYDILTVVVLIGNGLNDLHITASTIADLFCAS